MRRPRRRLRSATWLFCAVLALWALAPAGAAAAPAFVSVDDQEPSLEKADNGSASVAVGITNLTDEALTVDAQVRRPTSCRLGLDRSKLPAATKTTITVTVPPGCKGADRLKLEFTALTGGTPQVMKISATESEEKKPDWHQLWAFAAALAAAALLLTSLYFGGWTPKEEKRRRLDQRLGALEATWKFNDNWATNVTAAGALLTGLFGATVAKAFLGEDAESLVALATVGAAISAIFVAAAPIVALALKSYPAAYKNDKRVKDVDAFTVGGILCAATLVLTGAAGQLWVTAYTFAQLEIGFVPKLLVWIGFAIGLGLLALYSRRTLRYTFERGSDDVEKDDSPVEIEAANLIVAAIKAGQETGDERRAAAFNSLSRRVEQADRIHQRPRSALI